MKIILLLFVSTLSIKAFSQSWNQITDFPGPSRDDGVSFRIYPNQTICGSGRDAGFNVTSDFYVFDLGQETWDSRASLPDSCVRQYATSFSTGFNGTGFVFGGVNGAGVELNDLWRFGATPWGSGGWINFQSLPSVGRSGSSSFMIGPYKAYIIGGKNQSVTTETEVWEYEITNDSWTQKNDLPFSGIWRGVSFVDDTTGYIGLGIDSAGVANSDFYRYLPTTDQWELIPQLSMSARSYVSHAQIGDGVYLYGGADSLGNYLNTFERINLPSLTIDILTPFPAEARKGTMAFASNDDLYITTGVTATNRLSETWVAAHVIGLDDLDESYIQVFQSGNELEIKTDQDIRSIEIISMDGRTVKSKRNEANRRISIRDVESGVYLWHILSEGGRRFSGRIFVN
jgi:N-acetylneuraminic acid mutarotase|tara:strand:- start:176 stop:1375 length:1200 start_codon:yes stop_codon:yes gene_type:complete